MLRDLTITVSEDDLLEILEGLDKLYASSLRRCATVRPGTQIRTALDSRARNLGMLMQKVKETLNAPVSS